MIYLFIFLHRWDELHALASEPTEQHVLFAEDTGDAANGLYTTLTGSATCSAAFPGNVCKLICWGAGERGVIQCYLEVFHTWLLQIVSLQA